MLIIFDCDGVLVDSEIIAARELQRYLEEIAFPINLTENSHNQFLGLTLREIRNKLEAEAKCHLPKNFEHELRRRDEIAFTRDLKAMPNIYETVASLNFSKCVASSGSQDKIRTSLSITGLLDLFSPHIFSAGDPGIKRGKPAPDLFHKAAKIMGFDPDQCFVIEDSIAGVKAGLAAKMFTIGFAGGSHCSIGHGETLRLIGAHKVITDISSLPHIIELETKMK